MTDRSRDWDAAADERAARAMADGEPTRWFEELWSSGARDEIDLPWDRREPYPPLAEFVAGAGPARGRRAVVVGTGLGADAEYLAAAGYDTVAFDLSPSAVALAQDRYPGSAVDYRTADLLALPAELLGAFDLVVDVFTVQALPPSLRPAATAGVRDLIAPGGDALIVQFVRGSRAADAGPPWLLDRTEMDLFADGDVAWTSLEEKPALRAGGLPLWVGVLHRAEA